jgi:NADH-quinone oxidoreductase subunit J
MEYLTNIISNLTAPQVFFFLFAAIAVGSALEVVMQRNPLYSALALIVTFGALAANYILLKAQFIAAIQIIVYAGAIIVLFIFVIMLLNVRTEESRRDSYTSLKWIVTPSVAVLFAASFFVIRTSELEKVAESSASHLVGTAERIGRDLFTDYLLPFEAASVLIMMAIVGAYSLAQRTHKLEVEEAVAVAEEPPAAPPAPEPEEVEV